MGAKLEREGDIGGAVGGPVLLVDGATDGAPSAAKSVHSDSVGSLWLVAMTLVRDCVVEKRSI